MKRSSPSKQEDSRQGFEILTLKDSISVSKKTHKHLTSLLTLVSCCSLSPPLPNSNQRILYVSTLKHLLENNSQPVYEIGIDSMSEQN